MHAYDTASETMLKVTAQRCPPRYCRSAHETATSTTPTMSEAHQNVRMRLYSGVAGSMRTVERDEEDFAGVLLGPVPLREGLRAAADLRVLPCGSWYFWYRAFMGLLRATMPSLPARMCGR